MRSALMSWQLWAALSAVFAALTAIFAKVGVESVNSDFATFIRTVVILLVIAAILIGTEQWQPLESIPTRTYVFLTLSGLATGGWVVALLLPGAQTRRRCACRAYRQTQRRSGSSVWRCLAGRAPFD